MYLAAQYIARSFPLTLKVKVTLVPLSISGVTLKLCAILSLSEGSSSKTVSAVLAQRNEDCVGTACSP